MSLPHMEQALFPFFVGPQYLRARVWPGPVDCQWCSLAFLFLPSLRRKYNWEISRSLSSWKSFAYILCSHTNHKLSGLAVFVLEDCMDVAVSRLIPATAVKESRNFALLCTLHWSICCMILSMKFCDLKWLQRNCWWITSKVLQPRKSDWQCLPLNISFSRVDFVNDSQRVITKK